MVSRGGVTRQENRPHVLPKPAKNMGIDIMRVWMATKDERTRNSHKEINGEKRPVGKTFSKGCMFPGDPSARPAEVYNCRCTLVSSVDGIDYNANDEENIARIYNKWEDNRKNLPSASLEYNGKLYFRTLNKEGYATCNTLKISSIDEYGFPDGNDGVYATRPAYFFDMEEGYRLIYPQNIKYEDQTITPERVAAQILKMPDFMRKT